MAIRRWQASWGLTGARSSRLVLVAVLLVAGGVSVMAQDVEYVPERQTICWDCHVSRPPIPLKTFFEILPPEETVIASEPTPFAVRIRNPWLHNNTFMEVALDLTDAPSLVFTSIEEPIQDATTGAVAIDVSQPQGPHESEVAIEIPAAATSMSLDLVPDQTDPTTGPAFRMLVFTGNRTGSPQASIDGGPGEALNFSAGEEDLRSLGTGNWTVVVQLPVDPQYPGQLTADGGFTLNRAVGFDATDAPISYQTTRKWLRPNENALFTFVLRSVGEPVNETVMINVNAGVFYQHASSINDDDDNTTKTLELDVLLGVDGPVIRAPEDVVIRIPFSQETLTWARASEAIGYISTFLLVSSIWSGGMFGRASRRQLNVLFGSAKRRVAFHNALSYFIALAAVIHTVIFILEQGFYWTLGIIWGGVGLLCMFLLGVTGALQVPLIRRWNYTAWKWVHWGLTVGAIVFTIVHILLDGQNFAEVQDAVGWSDPFDPRL